MIKRQSIYGFVGFLAAASSLTSCTTVNTVERDTPVGTKQMVADKRVITDDTLIKKSVSLVLMKAQQAADFASPD